MQLWRDAGPQDVTISVTAGGGQLPAAERAALRLAAGTSPKAEEVFERTPAEFQRLGSLVTMLDLAVQHGTVDPEVAEQVTLSGKREHELTVLLPHLAFHEPIAIRSGERR